MKFAMPNQGGSVFQHFGEASEFYVYSWQPGTPIEGQTLQTADLGRDHAAVAKRLAEQGVSVVLCGGIGPGARKALEDVGMTVLSGITGSCDQAAANYVADELAYQEDAQEAGCGGCGDDCGGCAGGGCAGGCSGCGAPYVETRTFPDIVHLTAENFEEEVLQDPGLICIDFWAQWCGPCKMMAPIFEEVHAETPRVKFCKVDVDAQPELAKLFGIESIPTVVLVQNRRTLTGFTGYQEKDVLTGMIAAYLP